MWPNLYQIEANKINWSFHLRHTSITFLVIGNLDHHSKKKSRVDSSPWTDLWPKWRAKRASNSKLLFIIKVTPMYPQVEGLTVFLWTWYYEPFGLMISLYEGYLFTTRNWRHPSVFQQKWCLASNLYWNGAYHVFGLQQTIFGTFNRLSEKCRRKSRNCMHKLSISQMKYSQTVWLTPW